MTNEQDTREKLCAVCDYKHANERQARKIHDTCKALEDCDKRRRWLEAELDNLKEHAERQRVRISELEMLHVGTKAQRDALQEKVDGLTRYREKVHPDCGCCGWTDKVAELQAERDDYKASMETLEANANLWREQADKLKAENERLSDRVNGLLLELLIIAEKQGAENADNAKS